MQHQQGPPPAGYGPPPGGGNPHGQYQGPPPAQQSGGGYGAPPAAGYPPAAYGAYDPYAQQAAYGAYAQPAAQPAPPAGATDIIPPGCSVRVLYDYVASEKGVLSLRAGEVCTLEENKDQGWVSMKTAAGQVGFFPGSYIVINIQMTSTPSAMETAVCGLHHKKRGTTNLEQLPDPQTGQIRWVCKAGFECKGGWTHNPAAVPPGAGMGMRAQAPPVGLPGAFQNLQHFDPAAAYAAYQATLSGKPAMAAAPPVLAVLGKVKVLADYDATEATCLSLKKDEAADLVGPDTNGWVLLRSSAGTQGFFPASYTEKIEAAAPGSPAGEPPGSPPGSPPPGTEAVEPAAAAGEEKVAETPEAESAEAGADAEAAAAVEEAPGAAGAEAVEAAAVEEEEVGEKREREEEEGGGDESAKAAKADGEEEA